MQPRRASIRDSPSITADPAEDAAALLGQLAPLVAATTGLFVQINGVDFPGQPGALLGYRETFGLPGDNTFGVTSPPTDAVYGLDGFATDLMVADGHWLLLQNVPLGPLTIHFGGTDVFGNTGSTSRTRSACQNPSLLPCSAWLSPGWGSPAAQSDEQSGARTTTTATGVAVLSSVPEERGPVVVGPLPCVQHRRSSAAYRTRIRRACSCSGSSSKRINRSWPRTIHPRSADWRASRRRQPAHASCSRCRTAPHHRCVRRLGRSPGHPSAC